MKNHFVVLAPSPPPTRLHVPPAGTHTPSSNAHRNQADGTVTFTLRIPTLALPGRRELVAACEETVRSLSWVKAVTVSTKARRPRRNQKQKSRRSSTQGIGGGVGATGPGTGKPPPSVCFDIWLSWAFDGLVLFCGLCLDSAPLDILLLL